MSRSPSFLVPSVVTAGHEDDNENSVPAAPVSSPVSDHDHKNVTERHETIAAAGSAEITEAVEQPNIEPITLSYAMNELKAYWPFVLRYGISVGANAAEVYVIA